MNGPRCGKPMTRYEASNGPMPEEPACGRPEGHRGPCRSATAWARQMRAWPARKPRECGCGCGGTTAGWGVAYKRGHNHDHAGRWATA